VSVEFTTGTIDRVQLEPGTAATSFDRRPYSVELALCQRHFQRHTFSAQSYGNGGNHWQALALPVEMRVSPTPVVTTTPTYTNASSFIVSATGPADIIAQYTVIGLTYGTVSGAGYTLSAEL
jgi:hypothetical protein